MTPAELYDAVCAAITAREKQARAATPGPWTSTAYGDIVDLSAEDGHTVAEIAKCEEHAQRARPDAEHIAANDPAATIRHCEADLATLDDHKPRWDDGFKFWYCRRCECDESPCGELTRRAKAEQVEVADAS